MSGEEITITKVALAWTDMGQKMFNVWFTRSDGSKWTYRTRADDELDAYAQTIRKVEGAK